MPKVKCNLRTAFVCIVIAFVCLFGYLLLQNFCAELFINWGWETRKNYDLFAVNGFWLTLLITTVLVPILEELIFRLLSCKLLKLIKIPDWCVILISGAIFAIYHGSWSQLVYQFLMGIWLAWIFLKTHHIGWTILIHFINNAFIVTYTYFAGTSSDGFTLNVGNISLSVSLAIMTTVVVFWLIKKGIPNYEK